MLRKLLPFAMAAAGLLLASCGLDPRYQKSAYLYEGKLVQPEIGVRSVKILEKDGFVFKDSNNNGSMDAYEDWRLSPADRAADLVAKLNTSQQMGLLGEYIWGGFAAGGISPKTEDGALGDPEMSSMTKDFARYTLLRWPGAEMSATAIANKTNMVQEYAESEPFGIPVLITTDPIFGSANTMDSTSLGHQNMAPQVTDWPLVLGMGAINDPVYVKELGRIHAAQLRALGIRWILGPQTDYATEPMWSRVYDTFGSSKERVISLGTAYIQGLQGRDKAVDPASGIVVTMKHFPGGGANEGGMDSHSAPGRYNVFPGNNLEEHVDIMKQVIQNANPLSIMPNYSIFEDAAWNGNAIEQVNSHYATVFMQDILRGEIGWDGMITSDWSAISLLNKDTGAAGTAWGTESWSDGERIKRYVDNGGHQIGSGSNPAPVWQAGLDAGTISPADIAKAASKVLEVTFASGLFENPYVDAAAAKATIDTLGQEAHTSMMKAFTLLKNDAAVLPLDKDSTDQNGDGAVKVYYDGFDDSAINAYAAKVPGMGVTTDLATADYAVVRVSARHGVYFGLDGGVPLSWRDPVLVYDQATDAPGTVLSVMNARGATGAANTEAASKIADTIEAVIAAKATNPNLKIVLVVSMYRPFIIADYLEKLDVLAADFGMTDAALLDMVFQMRNGVADPTVQPTGTLPMELPSSQAAVYAQAEDLPDDTVNPSFKVDAGITSY